MKRTSILILAAGALLLSACVTSTEMETHEPWARAAARGDNGVVYMILHNHTDQSDELVNVSSDVAQAVEMHESKIDSNGVMQMAQRSSIIFAPDEEVEFKPGGLHIMLVSLKQDLKVGDEIIITLHFKNLADIVLTVPVLDAASVDAHDMP